MVNCTLLLVILEWKRLLPIENMKRAEKVVLVVLFKLNQSALVFCDFNKSVSRPAQQFFSTGQKYQPRSRYFFSP